MSMSSTLESMEIMFVKFLCESITAFGLPVVPEVKISDATALPRTFGGSKARRFDSSSSSGISKISLNTQTGISTPSPFKMSARSGFSPASFGLIAIADASPAFAKLTISSTELAGSIGIAVAPDLSIPKYVRPHSGMLFENKMTRSPCFISLCAKKPAARSVSSRTSSNVYCSFRP